MKFFDKYKKITKENNSYVCIGLDSDAQKMPDCLKKEENPVLVFNKRIIDATSKVTAAYKPNFAFYISQGVKGIETLKATIDYIPRDIPVILDIKVGDIGNTMEQYAMSVFNYFQADAMTINILMGSDVINSCLKIEDAFAFALALTSNESAMDFFKYYSLYEKIALMIKDTGEYKLGTVVGATQTEDLALMRRLMPQSLFLIPGIGAQGGDLKQVCELAQYEPDDARFLINSSRGIIFADNTEHFASVARSETVKLQEEINKLLKL
jgi:orotidine-5'-phosphate decarboxylase